jgi:hypothetical protein
LREHRSAQLDALLPSIGILPDDLFNGNLATIQVKVLGVDGAHFLGTELLVRQDTCDGQPCMQNGGVPYEFLGFAPYYVCHHFSTD